MKRFNGIALSVAFCSLASQAALAQTKIDTLKVQNLNEVIVKGVRAAKEATSAVANIGNQNSNNSLAQVRNCHFSFLVHRASSPGVRTVSAPVLPICAFVALPEAASM